MKPRHTTALALVGWYLMMPPLDERGKVDKSAPVSQWTILQGFDTARNCEAARAEFLRTTVVTSRGGRLELEASRCIAMDGSHPRRTEAIPR